MMSVLRPKWPKLKAQASCLRVLVVVRDMSEVRRRQAGMPAVTDARGRHRIAWASRL